MTRQHTKTRRREHDRYDPLLTFRSLRADDEWRDEVTDAVIPEPPPITEDANDNPDETSDDGLGIPAVPIIDPADVDEDEPSDPAVADPTDHVEHHEGE